jgi:hypothetical protein
VKVYALVQVELDEEAGETVAEILGDTYGVTLVALPSAATATAWLDDYRGER